MLYKLSMFVHESPEIIVWYLSQLVTMPVCVGTALVVVVAVAVVAVAGPLTQYASSSQRFVQVLPTV